MLGARFTSVDVQSSFALEAFTRLSIARDLAGEHLDRNRAIEPRSRAL
jgi:hypothetical protein